ncbi:MAG: C2 domain-containing protein, partial [Nannocystaceae bacterium]|nr:C2 domain-containing protein [Nannocystaceae bacterium]
VLLLDGEITSMQPGGGTWDAFGGAPDPYLDIAELEFESMFVDNTLDPVWNESVAFAVLTPDLQVPLTFRMRDSDVLVDQLIATCTVNLPEDAFGGLHEVVCDSGGSFAWSVLLSIEPIQK